MKALTDLCNSVNLIPMGDKSPKANQKKSAQNQSKNSASKKKTETAAASKQVVKPKK